ncbi:YcxB family protein [Enterovirga rhinocerotis]|nr:YcxB family protein [Enterovirga rhinocerotis]
MSSDHQPPDSVTPARTIAGVQLTYDDLLDGARAHFRAAIRRRRVLVIVALMVAAAFAFGTWVIPSGDPDPTTGIVSGVVVLAYLCGLAGLLYLVSVPRGVRKVWRQNKVLHETMEVSWEGGRYRVSGENVNSDMPWSYYLGWRETPTIVQLYYSPANYQILPKRHLDAAQQGDLRRTLAEAGVEEKRGPV